MKPAVSDPPEIERLLWSGVNGSIGYDIGANCGQSAAQMLLRFDQVYGFEPAAECWPYLEDTSFRNHNYIFLPIGISAEDEAVTLVALPDKIDTGQLVTAGTVGMEWNPEHPEAVKRTVMCRTIDTLVTQREILPPDFMKIDVEGHELKVLYGAKKTLATKRPDILLEFHSKELHRSCVDLLEAFDYECQTIRHPHYYPGTDIWWVHGFVRATCGKA